MEAPQFAGTQINFNFPMPTAPPGAHRHSWTRSTWYRLKNLSVSAIVIFYSMAEGGRSLNVCYVCIDLCVPLARRFIQSDQRQGQVRQDSVIYTYMVELLYNIRSRRQVKIVGLELAELTACIWIYSILWVFLILLHNFSSIFRVWNMRQIFCTFLLIPIFFF